MGEVTIVEAGEGFWPETLLLKMVHRTSSRLLSWLETQDEEYISLEIKTLQLETVRVLKQFSNMSACWF
jgi:hypothetical protein